MCAEREVQSFRHVMETGSPHTSSVTIHAFGVASVVLRRANWCFDFSTRHSKHVARHSYCASNDFQKLWVGRCVCAIDTVTGGVCAAAVLAKLALVLIASFLSRADIHRERVTRDCFLMTSRAIRAAGKSRPKQATVCTYFSGSWLGAKRASGICAGLRTEFFGRWIARKVI